MKTRKKQTNHGLSKHPAFRTWNAMVYRCTNPNHPAYPGYGGRGIGVYEEWLENPASFIKWCEENGFKKGLHLDREDNNEHYYPGNCRFVDRKTNNNNTRQTIMIEYKGQTKALSIWLDFFGKKSSREMARYAIFYDKIDLYTVFETDYLEKKKENMSRKEWRCQTLKKHKNIQ